MLANNDFMLYVQTACTIALLKVETISDCRERKLCQKSTSSLSKIISSFINCIPLVRTTALFYKKRVHGILLLFIEKFQNWKVNASEWSEDIGVYVPRTPKIEAILPTARYHTKSRGYKNIFWRSILICIQFPKSIWTKDMIKTKPFKQFLKLNGKSVLIIC